MTLKTIDWRIVAIALIPALGLSIVVTLFGGMLGLSESAVDRVGRSCSFRLSSARTTTHNAGVW
jgi:hypothetical protein